MNTTGKAAPAAVRPRHYSPSELSGELAAAGISLCERAICRRCRLPASDPLHIATNAAFRGRLFIPESEALRLCGVAEVAT